MLQNNKLIVILTYNKLILAVPGCIILHITEPSQHATLKKRDFFNPNEILNQFFCETLKHKKKKLICYENEQT